MHSVPYLPLNGEADVVLREPFPRKQQIGRHQTYYIRAIVNNTAEKEYRTNAKAWTQLLDKLVVEDKKLLNAIILVSLSRLRVKQHSPQADFLDLARK